MGVRLQFEGIRCFFEPQDVPLRPVTLLVGENSSGKTTFLAICQVAHAMAFGASPLPFNERPFSLGAYDQIASRRSGRSGAARLFSMAIALQDRNRSSLSAVFHQRDGQPAFESLRLSGGDTVYSAKAGDSALEYSVSIEGDGRPIRIPHAPIPNNWLAFVITNKFAELVSRPAVLERVRGALDAIQGEFGRRPYAFAPIRTSPQRTYDPVMAAPEPEGSHVPMLLAMLARSAVTLGWASMQAELSEFGAKSGLFDSIEVVTKGKKDSDPFQIGVKSDGPTFNLIDVGYGVSQALPILVDTIQRASSQTFLLQQPEVHLHPRAQAELGSFFARQADKRRRFVIETHSDYLVDRIRMEVRRKTLTPDEVALLYFERRKNGATIHHLELDRDGSITNPPPGYRQFFLNEERELLGI